MVNRIFPTPPPDPPPRPANLPVEDLPGMEEEIAFNTMMAILTSDPFDLSLEDPEETCKRIASTAYMMADAMIAERRRRHESK